MLSNSNIVRQGTSRRFISTRCCTDKTATNLSSNLSSKLSTLLEKKKEIDRTRWEKLKEISKTIDHIAKNDVKQTHELLKVISPVVGQPFDKKDTELKSVDLDEEVSS